MQTDVRAMKEQALAAATAWWQGRPFPYMPQDGPYPCSGCGRPITQREGTTLIGNQMRCPECTALYFGEAPTMAAAPPVPSPRRSPALEATAPAEAPLARAPAVEAPPAQAPAAQAPAAQAPPAQPEVPAFLPPTAGPVPPPPYPPVPLAPPAPPRRRRSRMWLVVVAVVAVAGLVTAGLLFWAPWKAKAPPPAPSDVHVVATTVDSVTLGWSAPAGEKTPDKYTVVVTDSHDVIGTVPGSQTTYQWTGLDPATGYSVQVAAYWGDQRSQYSAAVVATTATPPVADGRLGGSLPVDLTVTATTNGLTVGQTWGDTWTFTPSCPGGACDTVLDGGVTPPGYESHTFQVPLTRNGAEYSGSAPGHLSHCGVPGSEVDVNNTVTVTLTVTSAAMVGGAWTANAWNGTLQIDAPYTEAGQYYCDAQSITMSLASTG